MQQILVKVISLSWFVTKMEKLLHHLKIPY